MRGFCNPCSSVQHLIVLSATSLRSDNGEKGEESRVANVRTVMITSMFSDRRTRQTGKAQSARLHRSSFPATDVPGGYYGISIVFFSRGSSQGKEGVGCTIWL